MPERNELRVFISSTFRDLQEEREHLIKKIFPEIRALCRERGIVFTEVDLRWGLTDEQLALGQVIRACLEEVEKCRPYFIGITGDRYGFVPSYLDIQSEAERETIVVRYLAEYRKSLNAEQIRRVATDYKCGHPLFLKTVLEELRLVGRHEELDAKIASYLSSTGTEDLFQRVLERLEEDYNMRAVRETMVLLSASRSGLDERELSDISGLARLKIGTMMAGLDYHLVRKEGRLSFFHDYLRRAVEKRYLADEAKRRTAHLLIAEYFQSAVAAVIGGSIPVRMAGELAYQLHSAGAMDRLAACLTTMPVFLALYSGETRYEVLSYWSAMDEGSDIEQRYSEGLERWEMDDAAERSVGQGQVADLFERLGRWTGAIEIQQARCASATKRGDRSGEATSRLSLGWLMQLRGEYVEALAESSRALELSTESGDLSGVAVATGNMGVVYYSRGENDRAMECYERQLNINSELGDSVGISVAIGNMGNVYYNLGEYDRAIECFERKLSICSELGDRRGLSRAIGNMGMVYYGRGEYDRALERFERHLSICSELGDRRDVASTIGNMGWVCSMRGEYDRALEHLQHAAEEHRAIGDRGALAEWLRGISDVLVEIAATADDMPDYVATYLPDVSVEMSVVSATRRGSTSDERDEWRAMCLRRARECAEECVAISDDISKPDTQFSGRVLLARVAAAEGRKEVALQHLYQMVGEATDDDRRAELHYWLWMFGEPGHASAALALYETLYATAPKHEYRKRIEELMRSSI
jgi:tetratricopeptide (TPR) repeat protein